MPRFRLSPQAERDIEAILIRTHETFGGRARRRYEALLARAMLGVAESPGLLGSHDHPEIAPAARTYHLRHSRHRVRRSTGLVQRPRHFLLYRALADGTVDIGRVLHDGMDLKRHPLDDDPVPDIGG